jgi:amino acid adenylation domain-containing protein
MNEDNIIRMFNRAAERFETNTAVSAGGRQYSYRELLEYSNKLANFLIAKGASKGSVVTILTADRYQAIVSIIAVLKAGCVYAPLDPTAPAKRLEAMLSQVEPEWLIAQSDLVEKITPLAHAAWLKTRVIYLDRPPSDRSYKEALIYLDVLSDFPNANDPGVELNGDDICYVYFTSGSTGAPKGIAGRLKGIDHFIRWEIKTLEIEENVRVSQIIPASFDGSLRDIFAPLCVGGTACAPPSRETILDGKMLMEWIEAEEISLVHCVPSLLRMMVNEPLNETYFQKLRYILLTGEALLPADVKKWMSVYGNRVQLVNLYGTSETTMAKFCYFIREGDGERRSIPVGKPIPGAKALIVDEKGRPCKPGMVGEIYIRTKYCTLGYYGQPQLTREALIQNPFGDDPDDIVHKTGDIGRLLEDGNYEHLGRKDQQVKIRGLRVELSEVENVIRTYPGIRDVVVVDREDGKGYNYLCAYIVWDGEANVDRLGQYLSSNLQDYMTPSSYVSMHNLPRTLNGKIDRRALPIPAKAMAEREEDLVEPQTPVEIELAGMWKEVIGLERVGIDDHFFRIGGHSLLGTQLISRIKENFGLDVPLRVLFEAPTIAEMALIITRMEVERGDQEEIMGLMDEIGSLSDSDLDEMLKAETQPACK